jgi:murein DD-endopeptidase MepM/ murein hydrolase activator NlpD
MRIGKFILIFCFVIVFLAPSVTNVMGSLSTIGLPRPERTGRPDFRLISQVVQNGDSISVILDPFLPLKTIYQLNQRSSDIFSLENIRPGQPYEIALTSAGLAWFEYGINRDEKLVIQNTAKGYAIERMPIDYIQSLVSVSSTIESSLFEAVRNSGETGELAWQLSEIFAWDIDFIKDLRPGDRFQLLVDKRFQWGRFLGYGKIQAAMFTSQGKMYQAFYHRSEDGTAGYYDEQGNALEKAFLKAPLEFSRISSRFAPKRMHPILKEVRSHPGVDYAAPKGTPVKSVGKGIIAGVGNSSSTGNYVKIRHKNGYMTRYFHLSGFAKDIKKNQQVDQGQLIGYVGMSGYATGPHLCFRMTKNGVPVDPLTQDSPSAAPLPPSEMKGYTAKVNTLFQKIQTANKPEKKAKPSA